MLTHVLPTLRRETPCPDSDGRAMWSLTQLCFQLMASAEDIDYTDIENHEFAQYILREHGAYFPKWAPADVVIIRNAHIHAESRRCPDSSSRCQT